MTVAPHVVVLGDALIDEIQNDRNSTEHVGGAALNVAVGLSALGVRTTLVAMVGADGDGETIRAFVESHGVALVASPAPLGSSRATSVRIDGEPSYRFNEAARSRRIEFTPEIRTLLDSATYVVVSCFPFDDLEQARSLREHVRSAERRLIVDVNPRSALIRDADAFRDEFATTAVNCLVAKVGDDDAALLWATSPETVADELLAGGTEAVFLTLGGAGAEIHARGLPVISRPITPLPGPVIDTMGAGDATLASLIASMVLADGEMTEEVWAIALEDAMARAAATCRVAGATLQLAPALPLDVS